MEDKFVTVTGFKYYYGNRPFEIGRVYECVKEPDNCYDDEAIRVQLPYIGTIGYIANSINTRAKGTISAGRIYASVPEKFYIKELFEADKFIICQIITSKQ